MEKINLNIVGLSSAQTQSGSFALILEEKDGNRRLPIIIGMFEAQAIAIEKEKIVPNRPMTHDLFKSFADRFGIEIKEILISDLNEGVFIAKIICEDIEGNVHELDARPSDAIAIGIRFDSLIYASSGVMEEAAIIVEDVSDDSEEIAVSKKKKEDTNALHNQGIEDLKSQLNTALENEDYEQAAVIRDEINNRN